MYDIKVAKIFQPFQCFDLIRLGKDYDGGYLVSERDVKKSKILVSFGIGDDWSFERDFSFVNDCQVMSFDKDAKVDSTDTYFNTIDKFLIRKHVTLNNKVDEVSIDNVFVGDNIFLKCDIEGGEYDILDYLISNSKRFTGMVIEFHSVKNPKYFNDLTNFISKVDQKLLHIHMNNYSYYQTEYGNVPDVVELSFTSSDVVYDKQVRLPNDLDMPNNPNDADFRISFE